MGKMLEYGNSEEFRKHEFWRHTTVFGNSSLSKQKLSGKLMRRLLENYVTAKKIWLWIYSLWKKMHFNWWYLKLPKDITRKL